MKTKNEYIEILATELKELGAEIDDLTEKADQAAKLVKQICAADIEVLRVKQFAAIEKMKELDGYRSEAWAKSLRTNSGMIREPV
ncbi:MAG: coiled coil domain-containing protein [Gammaproteobacteria bacterium]